MELFQRAQNPWGQEVLVRISWNLFWLALLAGVLFLVFHLFFRRRYAKRSGKTGEAVVADASGSSLPSGLPEKVERHSLGSRLFHWVMAVAMLVLLFTGFLPQIGIQFSWVTAHWIAGVVLIATIVFHIVHATFFHSLRNIWISWTDIKEWRQEIAHALSEKAPSPPKPGKYPVDHKLYHHAVTVTGLGTVVTGILMMFRIETPLLTRNPYLYSDGTWGWIYVIHGLCAVGLVTLTITHIYFAILPEKRWMTWSMIYGWISRQKYVDHHDPERWSVTESAAAEPSEPSPSATTEAS